MNLSLTRDDLIAYTSSQLNNFFPDKNIVDLSEYAGFVDMTIDRLDYCFQRISFQRYNNNGNTIFNHLYTDQYLMYLWFLSNTVWKEAGNEILASKVYYLNKALHSFDCMYNTGLPDIFMIIHGAGTMLGKAVYSDYFLSLHGCTVGSHKGKYPVLGRGFCLTANSSIIGDCKVGDRCTISTRTTIFQKNLENDTTAFVDFNSGVLQIRHSAECYAQQYYNVDLKTL